MAFPDPEVLHAKLTSGDAGGIGDLAASLADAKSSLQNAAHTISTGAISAVDKWTGAAATKFVTKAKESSTAAAAVYQRLHTAETAITRAATAYAALQRTADAAIKPWRNATTTDDDEKRELAMLTIRNLMRVRSTYEAQLTSAAAGLSQRDTDIGGGGSGGWDSDGNADISGVNEGEPWTSQGLAYDGENLLVTSYLDSNGNGTGDGAGGLDPNEATPSRLTYVDYETGEEQKNVYLDGDGGAAGPPTHSGGIATDGKHTWVSSNGYVYVYDKADLDNAKPGDPPVKAKDVVATPSHSYVSYAEGKLFVGDYTNNQLHELEVDPNTGSPGTEAVRTVETPNNVQGVLVRDDDFVFSSSDGHNGKLYRQDRDVDGHSDWWNPSDDGDNEREEIELTGGEEGNEDGYDSHGIEELVEIDGEVVLAHESGAYGYGHNEWNKWDEPELTRISLDELGLDPDGALSSEDAGYETDPDSLTGAASALDEATSTLQSTARSLSGLQMVPHLLGEVPAAATFAKAATQYIGAAGDTVRSGSEAVGGIADSLVSSADAYRRMEATVSSGFSSRSTALAEWRLGR